MTETPESKAAMIALAGVPNAGKSTLMNRILGRSLSIATHKPQTTQTRILGIENIEQTQLVFTDTPGIHRPRGPMHDLMVGRARAEIGGADIVCWLVDVSKGLRRADKDELGKLSDTPGDRPLIVVLNKIDIVARPKLLPLMKKLSELVPQAECMPVSALRGQGVIELVARLVELAPKGPWLFPEDAVTDRPLEFMAAEFVREQLLLRLNQELPYRVAVKTELYERRKGSDHIDIAIYVDNESIRKIILGAGGNAIKAVGTAARRKIETLADRKVFLQLNVKVKANWHKDPRFLEGLGL